MCINYKFVSKLLAFFLVILFIFPICTLASDVYVWSSDDEISAVSANVSENSNVPTNLNLDCGSAILIEQNSGKVLYEQNMHEQLRPASVTKVMTILLIMEALDNGTITLDTPIQEKH